jgi:alkylation response protein AidB-like acyl-CoA dehydrogenase
VASNVTEEQAREVAEAARETEWKLPSFGKELFLGDLRLDLIHPQPRLDPAAVEKGERFLADLQKFLETEVDPLQIEADSRIPDHVVDGLKKLGALGMKVSPEYGGLGLSQVYYNRALAMVGVWHSALATLLSAHQSIGVAEPLRMFGSEEQRRKWLPLVAKDHISAFLLTEPDVGSDPARMATTATPVEGGYLINGVKLWATNGTVANIVVCMAKVPKSEGHRGGISAFVLRYDSEGITVQHRNSFMGMHGIENSVTLLRDVFVPEDQRIAREGDGLRIALATLNTGRLALLAISAGMAKYATKICREWGNERVQWGRPVGKHDEVSQKIAFIGGSAFGLEAMIDVCGRLADNKRNDIRIEAAIAKVYGSELGWKIIDDLIQVRGGRGCETAASLKARGEKPVPCEALMRDFRVNRIFEGSSEIMHLLIAREAVDQHLSVAGGLLVPGGELKDKAQAGLKAGQFYAKWFPKLLVGEGQNPRSFEEFGALAGHMRYVERSARKLARSTFYAIGRFQIKLADKGAFLGRIVDIGAELFAMASAVVYADTLGREQPARKQQAIELADLFCNQARHRSDTLFHELWSNNDDNNKSIALKLLDGNYTWLEDGIVDPAGDGPMIPPEPPKQAAPAAAVQKNGSPSEAASQATKQTPRPDLSKK